jgi:hypothetical protein
MRDHIQSVKGVFTAAAHEFDTSSPIAAVPSMQD